MPEITAPHRHASKYYSRRIKNMFVRKKRNRTRAERSRLNIFRLFIRPIRVLLLFASIFAGSNQRDGLESAIEESDRNLIGKRSSSQDVEQIHPVFTVHLSDSVAALWRGLQFIS